MKNEQPAIELSKALTGLNQPILTPGGAPIWQQDFDGQPRAEQRPFLVRDAIYQLLSAPGQFSVTESIRIWGLCERIQKGEDVVELGEDEHATLKGLIEKNVAKWPPTLTAQVWRRLRG